MLCLGEKQVCGKKKGMQVFHKTLEVISIISNSKTNLFTLNNTFHKTDSLYPPWNIQSHFDQGLSSSRFISVPNSMNLNIMHPKKKEN